MANKELRYSGYTAQPSDYECADGELAAAINLIPEDGALKPVGKPSKLFAVNKGWKVFIHSNMYTHYIAYQAGDSSTSVQHLSDKGVSLGLPIIIFDKIKDAQGFGNIIVFSGEKSLYYVFWDAKKESYLYLGTRPPKINAHFTLLSHLVCENTGSNLNIISSDKIQNKSWTPITTKDLVDEPVGRYNADTFGGAYPVVCTRSISFPNQIEIEAGSEYKFTVVLDRLVDSANHTFGAKLYSGGYGDPADERYVVARAKQTGKYELSIEFTADKNYSKLSFSIICYSSSNFYPSISSVSATATLSKGALSHIEGAKIIEYTEESYNHIAGAVNKFIADNSVGKERFIYPFFARYAVRLFDGTYVQVSAPCLLIPNSDYVPLIYYRETVPQLSLRAFSSELQLLFSDLPDLDPWKGLISAIDIFISQPLYTYDQGKNYDAEEENFTYAVASDDKAFGSGRVIHNGVEFSDGHYMTKNSLSSKSAKVFDTQSYESTLLKIGAIDEDKFRKRVEACSNFYKIASISLDELSDYSSPKTIELPKDCLLALAAKETLTDSYLPYESFAHASLHSYNNKLMVFGSSYILPEPYSTDCCSAYVDDNLVMRPHTIAVYLHTDDGDKCVVTKGRSYYWLHHFWYFYPDSRAYRAVFDFSSDNFELRTLDLRLKEHPLLNGAFAVVDSLNDPFTVQDEIYLEETPENTRPLYGVQNNNRVKAINTIYASEVNNPFVFNSASVISGMPETTALSSAARALSQGQFGQFPLYAFTTGGVWAIEIAADGAFHARQPITRDTCINADGITQIDSAVLFPTDRGIMLISGSSTQCITDSISAEFPFDLRSLPRLGGLHDLLHAGEPNDKCLPLLEFSKFLHDCRMIYDYAHQRVIVYNAEVTYAYVYSLKSQMWGMLYSRIVNGVNSYPNALAMNADGWLVDFSKGDDAASSEVKSMLVTRPLKLDAADILKTVDTVIQRGNFRKGHVQSVLYGSRDLEHWHLVWSSKDHCLRGFRGTPYKYFRIALLCNLTQAESIYGASVQFTPRLLNQPR